MSLAKLAKMVKQDNRMAERTIEELFISEVDDYIIKSRMQKDKERGSSLSIKPSSYYKCCRQLWYSLKGYPQTKKTYARSERILEVGTALHEWVQTQVFMPMSEAAGSPITLIPMEEMPSYGMQGISYIHEHKAPPMEIKFKDYRWTRKTPVSAMIDGALHYTIDMLFEFKTINPDDFKIMIEPQLQHIKQGALYALCTGIHTVMFLYLCKGTQNWKPYLVKYNEAQLNWVKQRLWDIDTWLIENTLPDVEQDKECKWCPYKKLCESNYVKE